MKFFEPLENDFETFPPVIKRKVRVLSLLLSFTVRSHECQMLGHISP